jgi:hypothetical protein
MDTGSNQTIREAIQKIALRGLVNPSTGVVRDTGKFTGYVTKVHTDGELAGTIDVQEFSSVAMADKEGVKSGYHEGVYLSAMQDNMKAMVIVPKMYSEVVVSIDPESKREYVTMFSHVDIIQLDSHERVTVGVREREPFDETDEESPDVHELEDTGIYTKTTYLKDSITTEAQGKGAGDKVTQTIDATRLSVAVGDDKSSLDMNQKGISLKHGKAGTALSEDSHTTSFGASKVKIEDGTVYIGSDSGTDDAVLGVELANILSELVGYIGQVMTPTMIGPQPPANIASFISLKAKIDSFKSTHGGFLTKKVQIQK